MGLCPARYHPPILLHTPHAMSATLLRTPYAMSAILLLMLDMGLCPARYHPLPSSYIPTQYRSCSYTVPRQCPLPS
eukprot:3938041-Rhodomonas_salina.3